MVHEVSGKLSLPTIERHQDASEGGMQKGWGLAINTELVFLTLKSPLKLGYQGATYALVKQFGVNLTSLCSTNGELLSLWTLGKKLDIWCAMIERALIIAYKWGLTNFGQPYYCVHYQISFAVCSLIEITDGVNVTANIYNDVTVNKTMFTCNKKADGEKYGVRYTLTYMYAILCHCSEWKDQKSILPSIVVQEEDSLLTVRICELGKMMYF